MKLLPEYLRATAFEYRFRFPLHGLIYLLGFVAPWHLPLWSFLQNQSTWFLIADAASKPTFANFAPVWNALCGVALVFAGLGAFLRVWGASYLGATTVHQGSLNGTQVVADGPYRYVRNPLYLGTFLHTLAVVLLMRPEAAVLTLVLVGVLQVRLIGREEPFLLAQQGAAYEAYCHLVPRLLPRLRPGGIGSGAQAHWVQGLLSEVYIVGAALTFAAVGWTRGFAWDASLWHVVQGLIIALGLSVVAHAFIPPHRETDSSDAVSKAT